MSLHRWAEEEDLLRVAVGLMMVVGILLFYSTGGPSGSECGKCRYQVY
jgi:hypothetical protein